MRILFLTKGDKNTASSRQRVWLIAEKLGYPYEVFYPSKTSGSLFASIRSADILFVHKSLFRWYIIFLILAARFILRKKLVYDLDDAEWEHSHAKTVLLAWSAHVVFEGSHIILEWVKKHNKKSVLIPTVVDHELYAKHKVSHTNREIYTIGWVGSGKGHFLDGHFAMIRPALDELWKNGVKFRFVIIGSQNFQPLKDYFSNQDFETIFVDNLDWQDPETVPREINKYQFDVGLMPTSDTPFNRAKCAFKAIEYMACGVPVVASPVGENKVVVKNGKTGSYATTRDEWAEAIKCLLTYKNLREDMGKQGLEEVRKNYSYEMFLPIIKTILNDL
jgi:glycosyltransferase involved in cell wall biosynthesis